MVSIPFTLTAAQVDTLDTTAVTIATLTNNSQIVRVPDHLVLSIGSGDAYTSGADTRLEVYDDDGSIWFAVGVTGFLTGGAAAYRVALPTSMAKAFAGGNYIIYIRASNTVAKGTASSSLKGEVYFNEYVGTL